MTGQGLADPVALAAPAPMEQALAVQAVLMASAVLARRRVAATVHRAAMARAKAARPVVRKGAAEIARATRRK